MSTYEKRSVRIYYDEVGSGLRLLLIARLPLAVCHVRASLRAGRP
jgi:hypothetical protein